MSSHVFLLDELETRLHHGDFKSLLGPMVTDLQIRRPDVLNITVSGKTAGRSVLIDVRPMAEEEAPDKRARLSVTGGPVPYADHAADGLVMGIFNVFLAARTAPPETA